MSQYFEVHPTHPQQRLLFRAADILRQGGVIAYPTDTTYALGWHLGDKSALERVQKLRRLDKLHLMTLVCKDLSDLATYARVDNSQFRTLKNYLPGPFTFVLSASRDVPRRVVHPKRRTIGLRVPDHAIVQGLIESLGEAMMSTTLRLPGAALPMTDPLDIRDALEHQVDLVIDGGHCGVEQTTVVDLTTDVPEVVRQGIGLL